MLEIRNWVLSCFYPYVPYFYNSFETGIKQKSIFPPINVTVPGSVQKALIKAGIIKDPFYDMQSFESEWIENKWWLYRTEIDIDQTENLELVFEGIDYKAKVFINGTACGESENMFVPLVIEAEKFFKIGKNVIEVVLEGAPKGIAQLGIASETDNQKSRFSYKWDFEPRIVHLGFIGKVYLKKRNKVEYKNLIFHGKASGEFDLKFKYSCLNNENVKILIKLSNEKGTIFSKEYQEIAKEGNTFHATEKIENIIPWCPNGQGKQQLYNLLVKVEGSDNYITERQVGFKDILIEKNENSNNSPFDYVFNINGKKTYIKGVNVVPLDVLYSDIPDEKYEKLFKYLKEGNINLVRVWGGGRIESELFYSLADKYGILVWQEFIQSGAGVNSEPSVIPSFLSNLEKTAREAVYKANHISLVAFSGGNELSDENGPVDFSNKNIAMLKSVVDEICPWIMMYPTSPSGGNQDLLIDKLGKNFDVHGPWKYYNDMHYKIFNESDSLFHSEFGCDGLTNYHIFEKYISKKNRVSTNMIDNYVWRHRGEWWDTHDRDELIFGKPKNLKEQILISQFMQAEGLRYAIEANRRRAFNNSGSIIWQANEPFPGISGTNLIDYEINPKFVYFKIKQAYAKVNPSLRYETFVRNVGEKFISKMYITADGDKEEYQYNCKIYFDEKLASEISGVTVVGESLTNFVEELSVVIPKCNSMHVVMEVVGKEQNYINDVLFPVKVEDNYASSKPIIKYMKNFKR